GVSELQVRARNAYSLENYLGGTAMRNTRIIVLVLAAVLALALTGIGTAQDEVQLTLAGWSSHPAEDAALRAALDLFMEENPGVTVEFIPSPDHTLTMQTAFASGDYAEVFYIDSSRLPDWVAAGVVAPAEDNIEGVEGFYPSLIEVFTIDGTLYCP